MTIDVNIRPVKRQATIAADVKFSGVALHGGMEVQVTLKPAPIGSGIVFVRTDLDDDNTIIVSPDTVTNVRQCTTVCNKSGVSVATIEHLMAALSASGIDNLIVDIDGPEVPALDGSSEPFLKMVEQAKIRSQSAPRSYIKVLRSIEVIAGEAYARIDPAPCLQLDVTIDFQEKIIGRQRIEIEPDVKDFRERLASARTFARAHEVAALREAGLSLGGSYDNAVVVDGDKVLNPNGLRYSDEFVRHKALDLLGDLYVAGPILGHVIAVRAGHALNHKLLCALFADKTAWEYTQVNSLDVTALDAFDPVSTLEEIASAL
ncbi:MAG: UDP-3-O-acyl-N-acetylglucosamine deacetylase [Robiginitomaculum sp.]